MIIFREQKGSLAESLAEAKEFKNVEEMKKYIVDKFAILSFFITADDIVIGDTTINDYRIGWEDSRNVCIMNNCSKSCIGICATQYKKNN